jgi:serine/threonine protein kinase
MVDTDPPGLVRVRRLNERRPGERQLGDRKAPGAGIGDPQLGQPPTDHLDGDQIHLALRISDASEVAVRVYAHQLTSDRDRARFLQEAMALKALNGDRHVVTMDEINVTPDGYAYVVMEYCDAGSLKDHLITVGRFTPAEVRRIGAKLAGALGAAHCRDIVHRSVKPSNILLNAEGEPVLADFGFVSLATVGRDFTPPSRPITPPFTAPEAYLPELMTISADVYSLGATLYAMLAGWAPRAIDPLAVAIDGDTLVDLPRVPWALMAVIRVAMAHDPADRFADAFQFQSALLAADPG